MKVQLAKLGVVGAMALVLVASKCSSDEEDAASEPASEVTSPESNGSGEATPEEAADPLGDPFVAPADDGAAKDPGDSGDAMKDGEGGDDSSMLDDPSHEPESVPESDTDL